MYMTPVEWMCDRHLREEHANLHAIAKAAVKNKTLFGMMANRGRISPKKLFTRHDAVAAEMSKRGMNHNSPLEPFQLPDAYGEVNVSEAVVDLAGCPGCKAKGMHVE